MGRSLATPKRRKTAPRRPKRPPRRPKTVQPRKPSDRPRRPQDGLRSPPKTAQEAPRTAQEAPKTAPRRPKTTSPESARAPGGLEECSRSWRPGLTRGGVYRGINASYGVVICSKVVSLGSNTPTGPRPGDALQVDKAGEFHSCCLPDGEACIHLVRQVSHTNPSGFTYT